MCAAYLLTVAGRLGFLPTPANIELADAFADLTKGLQSLIASLEHQP
jgi:hypothetical protein